MPDEPIAPIENDSAGGSATPEPQHKAVAPPRADQVTPRRSSVAISLGLLSFGLLYVVWVFVGKSYSAAFFALPLFMGAIVGLASSTTPYRNGLLALALGLATLTAALREGIVCILFSLPLLVPYTLLGVFCGFTLRKYVKSERRRRNLGAGVLLVGIGWHVISGLTDDPSRHPWRKIESEVAIQASEERIFSLLTSPLELKGPWPRILRVGLPIPRKMEVTRPGTGGTVRLWFNHGTAEAEILAWTPRKELAFAPRSYHIDDPPFFITRLGRGEHYGLKVERVDDWMTIGRVSYHIRSLSTGRSRLVRTTEYQRHLFPSFYFDWLQRAVVTAGQTRMLDMLRQKAEGVEVFEGPSLVAHR